MHSEQARLRGGAAGAGIRSAHGSVSASSDAAVRSVKSRGVTASSSSHGTGNDTGVPGRTRGLYAATTVAPPARVESRNTFPPRSSLTYAVVASAGSIRSARTAIARVAAATSSIGCSASGANTCTPFAPLVFTTASSPTSAIAWRTSRAAATAWPKPPEPAGGSRSRIRWVWRPSRISVGWYSTARWLPNQSNVRRSSQSPYATSRFELSAHTATRGTHSGVYFGRFFCMNGGWPGRTRITDKGRPVSSGRIRSRTASR